MFARIAAGAAAALVCAGCAVHGPAAPAVSVEEYAAKVLRLTAAAAPRPSQPGARPTSVEASDPGLAAALALAAAVPSARAFNAIGFAYMRHHVLDAAHEWFVKASHLDPADATSYDGQARVWRDWGFPHLALPDARRAVYFAPESPQAHNTLGTIFQALGRTASARTEYERATQLEPRAGYAVANLCALTVRAGYTAEAIAACRAAVAAAPSLAAARNNLALTYAAAGDIDAALNQVAALHDPAARAYNAGILLLLAHRYRDANRAFTDALQLRPSLWLARARAKQAVRLAAEEGGRP